MLEINLLQVAFERGNVNIYESLQTIEQAFCTVDFKTSVNY